MVKHLKIIGQDNFEAKDICPHCNECKKNMKAHIIKCEKLCCSYCGLFCKTHDRLVKHEADCSVKCWNFLQNITTGKLSGKIFNTPNARINIKEQSIIHYNVDNFTSDNDIINSVMEDEPVPQQPTLQELEETLSQETQSLNCDINHNVEKNEEYKFDIIQNQLNNIVNLQKQMNCMLNNQIDEYKSETAPDIIESDIDICESDITVIEPDHTITELNDINVEIDCDIQQYINETEYCEIQKYIYDNLDNFNNLYFHFEDKLDNTFNIGNDNIVNINQKKEILWLKISYLDDNLFDVLEMTSLNNDFIDYKNKIKGVETDDSLFK